MLFEKLTISANGVNGLYTEAGSIIRDCIAIGNLGYGFYSQGGEITGCLARENEGSGFEVFNASLLHCTAQFNFGYGFDLTSSRALDCDCVSNSSVAIVCEGTGSEIRRCRILNCGNTGIDCIPGSGGIVVQDCEIANCVDSAIYTFGVGGNMFVGNNLRLNAGGGIVMSESNNYLENNHIVSANGVEGIVVTSSVYSNNVVVRNVVAGGGSEAINYSMPFNNDVGPIGNASSATSPWANISH